MPDTPLVVIHHTPCNDGMTAAWAVVQAHPDAELRPAMHGKPFPLADLQGRDVVFVDICPVRADLDKMLAEARTVTVLDHHKTAQADLAGLEAPNLMVVFDMNRSGAGIAWDHFHVGQARPWLVNTVEDNDLWRFALRDTKHLMEAVRSFPSTVEVTGLLALADPGSLLAEGVAISRFKTIQVAQSVEFAHEVTLPDGTVCWASNVPFFLCSDVANVLAKKNADQGRPALGITYYMSATGKWALSFRTVGDLDCSSIAKTFGGGGHRNASGANVDQLPWSKTPLVATT